MSATVSDERAVHADLDLERELLGWALVTGRVGELLARDVDGALWFRRAHRLVWDAIVAVHQAGGRVGRGSVLAELKARGHVEDVNLADFYRLGDGVPDGPIGYQVDQLQRLHHAREMARRVEALARALHDPDALTDGTAETHLDLIADAVSRRPSANDWLTPEAQWAALREEACKDHRGRVPLGLPAIDAQIEGIAPGEVAGLMARPGIGKTLALCHAIAHSVRAGRVVLMFSLEMPAAQVVARVAGMRYRERPRSLWAGVRDGRWTGPRWSEDMPTLRVCERESISVGEMSTLVAQAARQVGAPALVVIDHLGLIGGDRRLSTYDRVSTQSRELKGLAKRHHCAVLVAIQVSREAGGQHGEKRLSLGSARDSGVVEEAVDYMLGMRRVDRVPTLPDAKEWADILWVEVLKHRHGNVTGFEHAYHIEEDGLWLLEQAACPAPHLPSETSGFGARRR